jgi:hypothetical protein
VPQSSPGVKRPVVCGSPVVGTTDSHRHLAATGAGEQAGTGHGSLAMPAHHSDRAAVVKVRNLQRKGAELDVARPGQMSLLEFGVLTDVEHRTDDLRGGHQADLADRFAGGFPSGYPAG